MVLNKRILAISSVVLGLAIVGYGVYVFQKPIEISDDAQTISKMVKYPEYENTLENRPFFIALGIVWLNQLGKVNRPEYFGDSLS